ncbi:MAG: hypothetical protein WBD09_01935 [Halobacteriota archaeon]
MKKAVKIPSIIVGSLVLILVLMAVFNICPPQGPWPMPPWCKSSIETPQIPSATTPTKAPTTVQPTETPQPGTKPEMITIDLVVTVPYWTQGDVYLGVGDNSTYLKLDKVNEVTYMGDVEIENGTHHYYSRGSVDTKEVYSNRRLEEVQVFDAVLDWDDSNKTIIKKDFQKSFYIGACHTCGVSYTKGNFIEPMKKTMDEIKKVGGNWINLVPMWFVIPDYKGNEIKPIYSGEFNGTSGWVHATIKDDDLITLINEAHSRGLKVYLSPHVAPEHWGPGVKGKGELEPSNPDLFFASYKNFINHYADIAQQTGVEMFSIGNELDTLTQEDLVQNSQIDKTAMWRDVIKSVRQHYKGTLTYSVSCMDEKRCGPQLIKFWDDLDVIGWEWYVPIATKEHESISIMKTNAERIVQNNIEPLYVKYEKPIVITEIGWEAYPGSCAHTYGVGPSKGGDRIEQASCYEAVFQAIENKDFVKGMHIWTWTANLEGDKFPWIWTDSANEVRFSITEKEIEKWYSKIKD